MITSHFMTVGAGQNRRDVCAVDHFKATWETNGIFVQEIGGCSGPHDEGDEEDEVGVEFGDLAVDLIYQGSGAPDSQLTNATGLDTYHSTAAGAGDTGSTSSSSGDGEEEIYGAA